MKLPARATNPMSSDYITELDTTAELDAKNTTMFQELIGNLRWATDIGKGFISYMRYWCYNTFNQNPVKDICIRYSTYLIL